MSNNMTPRQLRRMEERRTRKQDRNQSNAGNAQHSTGPKTEAGKAASSRNAVRHGLTGTFCVLPGEDQDAFLFLLGGFFTEHNPQSMTEELLVSDMARHYWLVQRAMRLQEEVMTRDFNHEIVMKQLALFIRYQTTNQRAFHKCLADLQKLQKQRRSEEEDIDDGFVSQAMEARARINAAYSAKRAASATNGGENGFVSQPDASNPVGNPVEERNNV